MAPAAGETVKASLIGSDGKTVVDSVTLGESSWKGEFKGEGGNGALVYDPQTGKEIDYTVSVEENGKYIVRTEAKDGGFIVTNSKPVPETPETPETTDTPNTADRDAGHDAAGWALISAGAALVAAALAAKRLRSSER